MKIGVSSTGGSLDAQIDPRFGRCPYFVIVDSETMQFETVANTASGAMGGAGIQAAQLVANRGVQTVLTGSVGPNAFQALSSAGISIITGISGTVRGAVEKFKSGQLQKITAPTTPMGFGMGGGYGMGMGRGRGGGRGMGLRRWQAAGPLPQAPTTPVSPMPPQMSREQEIQMLESQMESIQKQLDQIRKRLKELKG
jgi:predicted Fe-Mo cluster-binding NifX family protein